MQPIDMHLRPIGVIHSPWQEQSGTPIQGAYAPDAIGSIEVHPEFTEALTDIEGFSHVWVLYWFDRARPYEPLVRPYLDDREHGVLATRAPCRPNPLGISLVGLRRREGRVLHVAELDVLDGTPLLDLKPYVPEFDARREVRVGWMDVERAKRGATADGRFERPTGRTSADKPPREK